MSETVKLPIAGDVKKQWVYVAGAVVVGVVGIGYYRKKKTGATKASTPATAGSTDPNAIDPATGLTYAEEAAQQGGYMYGSVGSGGGGGGNYDQYGNLLPAPIYTGSQNPSLQTNEEWLSQAETLNLGGVDVNAIAAAITKILGGIAVTQDQADLFHEITGIMGNPPQGNPPIKLITTGGPGGSPPPKPQLGWSNYKVQRGESIASIETRLLAGADLSPYHTTLASVIAQACERNTVVPGKPLTANQGLATGRDIQIFMPGGNPRG